MKLEYNFDVQHAVKGKLCLRWPNTVFARGFADAIERAHKDCKNKHAVNRAIIFFTQHSHYLCYFSLLLNAVY